MIKWECGCIGFDISRLVHKQGTVKEEEQHLVVWDCADIPCPPRMQWKAMEHKTCEKMSGNYSVHLVEQLDNFLVDGAKHQEIKKLLGMHSHGGGGQTPI